MSLNFSIESILRHGNVETNSTLPLITSGLNKLNQTNFLDESTSAFLKKQHLNYLSNQTNSTLSTNGLNNHQLNETINSNLLQSQLFYLNNLNKQNLIDGLQTNGSTTVPSTFGSTSPLELNHLNHLNSIQLQNHLAQLTQFNRYHYLNKLNSIYNTNQNDLNSSTTFKNLNQQNLENGKSSINLIGVSSNESQCSPLSDKSSEMILNYDDSCESQHSGNNISINSNNSANNSSKSINQSNSSNSKDKEPPLCTKCKLHGMRNFVKGHKKSCPMKDCMCNLCILTDFGKRLRGKKCNKGAAALASSNNQKKSITSTATNIHQTKTPIAATTNQLLMNIDNLNSNLNNSNLNDNSILLSGLQSTTPNSNSNSSCSNVSMSATLTSLNQQQQNLKTTSTNSNPNIDSLTNEQLYFLEKSAKKDYMKIVINILKDKLAQDGLNFNEEIRNLNIAVIYLLLNKFGDKNELYTKFLMDA